MKHLFTLILAILMITMWGSSQAQNKQYGGMGYFMTGWGQFSLSNLNDRFSVEGLPEAKTSFLSLGGGGHALVGRWVIGGEGHGLLGGRSNGDSLSTSTSGGYGFFNLGYLVVAKPMARIYPMIGIGGGGLDVRVSPKDRNYSFNDLLADPAQEFTISSGNFLLNLSIGLDHFFGEQGEQGAGGLVFGLRAGYNLAPFSNSWYIDTNEVTGSPAAGIDGPFVRLIIGGGGVGIQ